MNMEHSDERPVGRSNFEVEEYPEGFDPNNVTE